MRLTRHPGELYKHFARRVVIHQRRDRPGFKRRPVLAAWQPNGEPMTPEAIRAFRATYNLSQRALGDHLGVTQGTISRWEQTGDAPAWLPLAIRGLWQVLQAARDAQTASVATQIAPELWNSTHAHY